MSNFGFPAGLSYPVVQMTGPDDKVHDYYRVDLEAAVLLCRKDLIDSGESSIDAEIESLLRPRP
jgi:hypothetical protein